MYIEKTIETMPKSAIECSKASFRLPYEPPTLDIILTTLITNSTSGSFNTDGFGTGS